MLHTQSLSDEHLTEEDLYDGDVTDDDAVTDEELDAQVQSFENMTTELRESIINGTPMKGVTSKLVGLLTSEGGEEELAYLGNRVTESDTAFLELYASEFTINVEYLSYGELLAAADLQEQWSVQPSRISAVLSDPKTGLLPVQALFNPPVVYMDYETGEPKLVSGFHRLASIGLLLSMTPSSYTEILSQRIPVLAYTFNPEFVTSAERASELVAGLWLSGNQTRKPLTAEMSYYTLVKSGVRAYTLEAILESPVYSNAQKFAHSFEYRCLELGYAQRNGFPQGATLMNISPAQVGGESSIVMTAEAAVKMASSFLANVGKIVKVETINGKEKKTSVYKLDAADLTTLLKWVDWMLTPSTATGRTPVEQATSQVMLEEVDGGPSRHYAKIGKALAGIFQTQVQPKHVTTTSSRKAAKGKGLSFRNRRG